MAASDDDIQGYIALVFILMALSFGIGMLVAGYATRRSWQEQTVARGAAEYVLTTYGAKWQWKEAKNDE